MRQSRPGAHPSAPAGSRSCMFRMKVHFLTAPPSHDAVAIHFGQCEKLLRYEKKLATSSILAVWRTIDFIRRCGTMAGALYTPPRRASALSPCRRGAARASCIACVCAWPPAASASCSTVRWPTPRGRERDEGVDHDHAESLRIPYPSAYAPGPVHRGASAHPARVQRRIPAATADHRPAGVEQRILVEERGGWRRGSGSAAATSCGAAAGWRCRSSP